MQLQIAEFTIGRPRDVGWSAQRARILGSLAGLPRRERSDFGKAVGEVVAQVIQCRGEGTVRFGVVLDDLKQQVEAVIRIQSRDLRIVSEDLRSQSFETARRLVRESSFARHGAQGAVIRLAQSLPQDAEHIRPDVVTEWSMALATRSSLGALASSQKRIGELAESLQSVQQQGIDLQCELENLKSLNETLELLALVASKTENAVIILDAETGIEWVNDGFVRMTGYEMADVQQRPIVEVLYGIDVESESARELSAALTAGHGISQEILHQRKDGRTYWASISITPVFSETGVVTRWIGIANDATSRRHAQEALQQARDAAEAASRAKSDFLTNMSHEIRTPMNAVIGMTELALGTLLDDEQREYLTTALDSAEELLRLLNDILDLSKIEAGKLAIDTWEFSLGETLTDALRVFTYQSNQKGLQLNLQLPPDLPERVIGDAVRLRQIFSNLVGNAIKFTHEGEVVLAVKCAQRTDRNVDLEFAVRDTGIGIAPDKLQQIFEAFTQADSSTSRRFGGTGLGLTISTQLVEMMGGQISVESEVRRGSTFRFALQFELPSDAPGDRQIKALAPAAATGIEGDFDRTVGRSLHVLVADDNRANRQLAMRILQKHGDTVAEAENGRAVIELLRQQAFDVLLLDVQMPEMDGLEATAAIRQMGDELAQMPYIIAVTAHAMAGDRERCLAVGMDAYLAKPIRTRQLLALIESVAAADESRPVDQELPPTSTYDFSAALQRLEGDDELLVEQMLFFLEDSPILIRDVRAAVESKDFKKLQMAAHRLRGLCGSFDAHELVKVAELLEDMGRARSLSDDALSRCDGLERKWEGLCSALRAYSNT